MGLERDKSACSVPEYPECCGNANPAFPHANPAIPGVEENTFAVMCEAVNQI